MKQMTLGLKPELATVKHHYLVNHFMIEIGNFRKLILKTFYFPNSNIRINPHFAETSKIKVHFLKIIYVFNNFVFKNVHYPNTSQLLNPV